MKIRTDTLVLFLILTLLVSGCRATQQPEDNHNNTPPSNLPWIETVDSQFHGEGSDQEELPTLSGQPHMDLSIDITTVPEQKQTRLGPFYGLLPELVWSPSGRYLAIFGEKNGYGLWIWDQQTQTCRRLVQLLDRSGQRLTSLAFFGWNTSGDSLLYAVDGMQSEESLLGENGVLVRQIRLDGRDKILAWLPGAGTFIRSQLFHRESGRLLLHRGQNLWVVDTNNGRYKQVKSDLPVWDGLFSVTPSPTGAKVVYPEPDLTKHRLVILDMNSGEETAVGDANEYSFYPVWSPDGEKLAFLSARAQGEGYDFQIGEDGPLPPATKITVTNKQGQLLAQLVPPHQEKAGAPVWSHNSNRLAFLTASVGQGTEEFPEIKWRRLLMTNSNNKLQDGGTVSGDWLIIGGCTPDGNSVLLYSYEIGGGVTAIVQGPLGKTTTLAQGAVDEAPVWWDGKLILPHITENNGDHLDTQLYLHDSKGIARVLTSDPGWKSGVQISGGYMAYTNADNQNYPYPLTVVVEPLSY